MNSITTELERPRPPNRTFQTTLKQARTTELSQCDDREDSPSSVLNHSPHKKIVTFFNLLLALLLFYHTGSSEQTTTITMISRFTVLYTALLASSTVLMAVCRASSNFGLE